MVVEFCLLEAPVVKVSLSSDDYAAASENDCEELDCEPIEMLNSTDLFAVADSIGLMSTSAVAVPQE